MLDKWKYLLWTHAPLSTQHQPFRHLKNNKTIETFSIYILNSQTVVTNLFIKLDNMLTHEKRKNKFHFDCNTMMMTVDIHIEILMIQRNFYSQQ